MARRKIAYLYNYEGFNAEAQNLWENILFARDGGYEPLILGPDSKVLDLAKHAGIEARRVSHLCATKSPFNHLLALFEIIRIIRRERPDVLHIYYRSIMHSMGIVANWLTGSRMLVIRTRGTATPIRRNLGNRILYGDNTALTIVPSERERKQLLDFGLPEEKVVTLHFPLDTGHFDPDRFEREESRKKHGIDDEFCLLHIGRFEPVKGHRYLLEAARILEAEGVDFTLLLIGDIGYPEFAKLKPEIRGKVRLIGWVEDVAELIAAADAGVISSIGPEANSRVALEFMAMKKPLVSTDVGILPDIVPGHGIVVRHANANALAEGIRQIITMDRKTIGEKGYRYVHQQFAREGLKEQFLQIYRKILQN